VIDPNAPGAIEATSGNPSLLLISVLIGISICIAAPLVFARGAPRVAEEL
jgi:hypothetical protein